MKFCVKNVQNTFCASSDKSVLYPIHYKFRIPGVLIFAENAAFRVSQETENERGFRVQEIEGPFCVPEVL